MNREGENRGTHTQRAGKKAKRRTRFDHTPPLFFFEV